MAGCGKPRRREVNDKPLWMKTSYQYSINNIYTYFLMGIVTVTYVKSELLDVHKRTKS